MACKETLPMLQHPDNNVLGVVFLVALCQGALGLADLAVTHLFREEFHMGPGKLAVVVWTCSIPWLAKPLWGFLSDSRPVQGKRRGPYLTFFALVGSLAWVYLAQCAHTVHEVIYSLFFVQLSAAFCSAIGEALVVEESRNAPNQNGTAANYVTLFFGVRALCFILTTTCGETILDIMNKREIILLTAAFPVILCASARHLVEKPLDYTVNFRSQVRKLAVAVSKKETLFAVLFVFLCMAMPTTAGAMLTFYTKELHFGVKELARLKISHGFASLAGIGVYTKWLRAYSFRQIFVLSSVLGASVGVSQLLLVFRLNTHLGLSDSLYSVISGMLVQTVGEIASVPLLVLCCRICPKDLEATMYALLASIMTIGSTLSQELSHELMMTLGMSEHHFQHLWMLVLLVYLVMLLPLPLLRLLPRGQEDCQDNGRDTL